MHNTILHLCFAQVCIDSEWNVKSSCMHALRLLCLSTWLHIFCDKSYIYFAGVINIQSTVSLNSLGWKSIHFGDWLSISCLENKMCCCLRHPLGCPLRWAVSIQCFSEKMATNGYKLPWQLFHLIAWEIIHSIVLSIYQLCHGDFKPHIPEPLCAAWQNLNPIHEWDLDVKF